MLQGRRVYRLWLLSWATVRNRCKLANNPRVLHTQAFVFRDHAIRQPLISSVTVSIAADEVVQNAWRLEAGVGSIFRIWKRQRVRRVCHNKIGSNLLGAPLGPTTAVNTPHVFVEFLDPCPLKP